MKSVTTELLTLVTENQKPGMVVTEIGIGTGSTTWECLPIIDKNGGYMILVDDFSGGPGFENLRDKIRETSMEIIYKYPKTVLLVGLSWEMSSKIENNSVDIVYIDADHRYSSVVKDIKSWAPKVKYGGILSGHDCENISSWSEEHIEEDYAMHQHHGVSKAVSKMINDVKFVDFEGSKSSTWFTTNLHINIP